MLKAVSKISPFLRLRSLHTSSTLCVTQKEITQCYALLKVPEDCSSDDLRHSYLQLAKQYHPDSRSKSADTLKFAQVKDAYQTLLNHREKVKDSKQEAPSTEECDLDPDFDLDFTAPQHRQYLSYDGVGFGPLSLRQKQHGQYRLDKATEAAAQYRADRVSLTYETGLAVKERRAVQKIQTRSSIDRLVEDLIAESMAKGEFDNLPGKGKPLDYDTRHNPMLDCTTNNLNRILIENGYVPGWIQLEKDIRESITKHRQKLLETRIHMGKNHTAQSLSEHPVWLTHVGNFNTAIKQVNKSVETFNLTVPWIWKQMMTFNAEKEVRKVLDLYREKLRNSEIIDTPLKQVDDVNIDVQQSIKEQEENSGLKGLYSQFKSIFSTT